MLNNEIIWKIYFLFYSFLSLSIILILQNLKIFNLNQIFSFFYKNFFLKFFFSFSLLSLGGLPPFLGFFPKWLLIELLIFCKLYLILFFLINFSLITLYFYLRICFSSLILNFNKLNFNLFNFLNLKIKKKILFFNSVSIFGLFFINLIFF